MKAITTKYHGPTNTRGARITATDEDGNRITISYPHELDRSAAHDAAALELCRKMRWFGRLAIGETKLGRVYVWIDEDEQIQADGLDRSGR